MLFIQLLLRAKAHLEVSNIAVEEVRLFGTIPIESSLLLVMEKSSFICTLYQVSNNFVVRPEFPMKR